MLVTQKLTTTQHDGSISAWSKLSIIGEGRVRSLLKRKIKMLLEICSKKKEKDVIRDQISTLEIGRNFK